MAKDSTRSVHGTERLDPSTGSVLAPIYQTVTFGFRKAGAVANAVTGVTDDFVYTRWDNPTTRILERKVADLEGGGACAFFSSGMAAISTTVLENVHKGDHVVATRDLYGETYRLVHDILPQFGVRTTLVDSDDLESMKRSIRKDTKVVYIETPTNPTLKLVDIRASARLAHSVGAILIVDSTFASPLGQCPLKLGADIVVHGATKYLNGHSDVMAGAVAGDKEMILRIRRMRKVLGGTLDPHAAFLVLRGIKTLAIRMQKHNENAIALAAFLEKHPKVRTVNYPGLESHPQHMLAKRQMKGYGGMLSVELKGTLRDAMRFTESLKVATLGASLGAVETLVVQPASMTHTQLTPEDRRRTGISDTLIRVSVGIEDAEDLIEDFSQALARL
ncbi:MAG: aminotransferase class I/II-fold pyridoxal phosphate-dependent enzyme [Nitrososphaerota archaeon]|nr:aminotransferase class I/II-fold pyridoxal phosphate-dependent enzyme [Nitrososphaerota archaeon]